MVHASQSLVLHRTMAPTGRVEVTARVSAVWDKGSNTLVELTCEGTDGDGTLFTAVSGTMLLGVGGWGGERGPSNEGHPAEEPAPVATRVVDDQIRPEQAAVYRLSGDRNPLHIDPGAARSAGFDDVFLHGLCTLGFAARAVIGTVGGGDASRLTAISCRFATPVSLGRPLRTEVVDLGDGAVTFTSFQDDRPALGQGRATVAPARAAG